MDVNNPVSGYIPEDLLTTQGDLIHRGAAAAERMGAGTAGLFLKSNGPGNSLAYDDPLDCIVDDLYYATKVAGVTIEYSIYDMIENWLGGIGINDKNYFLTYDGFDFEVIRLVTALRAYMTANQNIAVSTTTVVQLNETEWDNNSDWSDGNYRFSAPFAGYYLATGQCTVTPGADGDSISVNLCVNDTDDIVPFTHIAKGTDEQTIKVGALFKLALSDLLNMKVRSDDNAFTVISTGTLTQLNITRLPMLY